MRLKFHSFEFDVWALLKAAFLQFFKRSKQFLNLGNKMLKYGTNQISFKSNEKCWITRFHQKLEIITTKVGKEDF
jgi:hypothetical protein